MSNKQKVAIVTGASQGIGAGVLQGYRDQGFVVVAASRKIQPSSDEGVVTVAGDVSDRQVAQQIVDTAISRFGRIDTLINNAGVFIAKPFTDYTAEDFNHVVGVNLAGFFHITQLALQQMEKQNHGHIVQITTSFLEHSLSTVTAGLASLTKGGLAAITGNLAIEYARKGIRVNAVAPGIIKTPMHPKEAYEFLEQLHPIGRMGNIAEIVDAIMYLERATFTTGETIHVDGGLHAGH